MEDKTDVKNQLHWEGFQEINFFLRCLREVGIRYKHFERKRLFGVVFHFKSIFKTRFKYRVLNKRKPVLGFAFAPVLKQLKNLQRDITLKFYPSQESLTAPFVPSTSMTPTNSVACNPFLGVTRRIISLPFYQARNNIKSLSVHRTKKCLLITSRLRVTLFPALSRIVPIRALSKERERWHRKQARSSLPHSFHLLFLSISSARRPRACVYL